MSLHSTDKSDSTYLCSGKLVLRAIILAQAIAILLAFAPGTMEDRWLRLSLTSFFVQWVTLLTLMILCMLQKRYPLLTQNNLPACAATVLLLTTMLVSTLAYRVLTGEGWEPQTSFTLFLFHNLLIASIVGIIGFQFYLTHIERSLRIAAQSRAELDALQARIRPHFLFNTLNTVAELIRIDREASEKALLNLSQLFRSALHAGERTTLENEIKLAKAYAELEQWRLGDRLEMVWEVAPSLPLTDMPTLTLQPLIENAIRYGIEQSVSGGKIVVTISTSAQRLTVLIINPFIERKPDSMSNGMAIANIRKRLELMHGDTAQLIAGQNGAQYRVKLVLPVCER